MAGMSKIAVQPSVPFGGLSSSSKILPALSETWKEVPFRITHSSHFLVPITGASAMVFSVCVHCANSSRYARQEFSFPFSIPITIPYQHYHHRCPTASRGLCETVEYNLGGLPCRDRS